MIRAVDRLSRMYLQLPKATRLCGVVILLSRGEFGRERNKISYQRGCAWTFCYVSIYDVILLWYSKFFLNNLCERSYFVFNFR